MARLVRSGNLFSPAVRRQLVFWGFAAALLLGFLLLFRDILLPFLAGMALAYFLDPVADWLERRGFSRGVATAFILLVFLLLFVGLLLLLVPELVRQGTAFLRNLPGYVLQLRERLADIDVPFLTDLVGDRSLSDPENIGAVRDNIDSIVSSGAQWLAALATRIWASGRALVDVISLLVITPIVAFYLLYDWDRMIASIDSWVPHQHRETVRGVGRDMNSAIAGFVRGQGTVCLILGTFYALALTMTGLNFGLLIGMFAGLISFIPFVGSIVGFVLAVGVALVQFWPDSVTSFADFVPILVVGGIFVLGQFLEGNFLQPKLVGESVGLHPVWLMFALLAFGSLFGFTGLLVAVPVAAAIGVLVRFALGRYLASDLYLEGATLEAVPEGKEDH